MMALSTYPLSTGPSTAVGIVLDGHDIGTAVQDVVADGALMWSAHDERGVRLGSFLTMHAAVTALVQASSRGQLVPSQADHARALLARQVRRA